MKCYNCTLVILFSLIKDLEEPLRFSGDESMERYANAQKYNLIRTSTSQEIKPSSKSKPDPLEKTKIIHSLCDLLTGSKPPKSQASGQLLNRSVTSFEEISTDDTLTSESFDESLVKEISQPERRSGYLESDEFEKMLLEQGIISLSEYKQKIKQLEPTEQEFKKILDESYPKESDAQDIVILNQRQQKLSPLEIKTLEEILKTHGMEEPAKPQTSQFASVKRKPDFKKSKSEAKTGAKVKTVTFDSQSEVESTSEELKNIEKILHDVESKSKKVIDDTNPVVTFNSQFKQKITPDELKDVEKMLRAHSVDEEPRKKPLVRQMTDSGQYNLVKELQRKDQPPTTQQDYIKTTIKYEEKLVILEPRDEKQPVLPPAPVVLPKFPPDSIPIRYKYREVYSPTSSEHQKNVQPQTAPEDYRVVTKIKEVYNIPSTSGVNLPRASVKPKNPKLGKYLKYDGLIHTEECDDYCNYIKKIERDSSELESHLKALRLVDPTGRENSSIDDLIVKLNQFDVDSLLSESHRRNIKKDQSRSLDDLSINKKSKEYILRKSSTPGLHVSKNSGSDNVSKLMINGKKIESFSRSVLDLTRVGLPKTKKPGIGGIYEDDEDGKNNAKIKLLVRKVDPGKSEIEIKSVGPKIPKSNPPEFYVLDRRCSEVFGQRADASPYLDEAAPTKPVPLTLSLQSLDKETKKKNSQRKYDKLQSMECLSETREVGSDPECRYSRIQRHPKLASKQMSSESSSALSINRLYVHTPYDRQFRDLMQPKMPKSILKKTSSFQPMFESISLTSLPDSQKSMKLKDGTYTKTTLEKSRSCGSVNTQLKYCSEEIKFEDLGKPTWNKFVVPTSPLSQNRSASSNSLSDSHVDSDSSRVSSSTNPPATLIHYITPSKSISFVKPYVDYYDWSKQEISEDDANLSELECLNVQSDDSEFADRSFGYFYKDPPKSD